MKTFEKYQMQKLRNCLCSISDGLLYLWVRWPGGRILSPWLRDIVDSGWHRIVVPACQPMQPGEPVLQPYAIVDFLPPVRD